VLVLGATLAALDRGAPDDRGRVPTALVERGTFVRRVEGEGHLRAARSVRLAVPGELRQPFVIAALVPDGSPVEAGDPVVRFDATELQEALATALAELAGNELRTAQEQVTSAAQLANLGRDAELAGQELQSAREFQKKDAELFSRHDIVESEVDQELAAHRRDHAIASRELRGRLSAAQLQLLAIEGRQARQRLEEAEEGLQALEIRAPHGGIVVLQRDHQGNLPQVGDTVYPGNVVAEIPDLGAMEAEVFVLEADAGGLAPGQPAKVRIEAHPQEEHRARVRRVDALAKPRVRGSPVQYFALVLALDETRSEGMKPGQRVRAEIEVERQDGVLLVPRQAVFEDQGRTVVFRLAGDRFEPVAVQVEALSLSHAVIADPAAPVEPGDRVAVVDPRRPEEQPAASPAGPTNGSVAP
jgi:multidrug efflux pump subunit AcrA (membrane-fusion protein)